MKVEVKLNERVAEVELLGFDGEIYDIRVDDTVYKIDSKQVKSSVYSVLLNNKSFLVDVDKGKTHRDIQVLAWNKTFDVEIIDAEAKYLTSRGGGIASDDENVISAPMPGKVVKVLVEEGQELKAGDTTIIISAMKMESEYKVKHDCVVKEVRVSEGDTIDGHQPLVIVE